MILILFQWLTQLFFTIFNFIVPPAISADSDMCVFIREPATARGATSAMILLNVLKYRTDFLLRGRRHIHVERVEYRKSRARSSPLQREYLVVTVKESLGAGRRGYFLVDWPNDNLSLDDAQASSVDSASLLTPRAKFNIFRKWDPPDLLSRLVLLRNISEALKVQNRCAYDIVMSMDLHRAPRHVTLEDFLVLIQTTSMNTPPNFTPYTICTVLELATGAHIKRTRHQGKYSWPGQNEPTTPDKVKSLWEAAKVVANQEFDEALKELHSPGLAVEQALRKVRKAC
ncbi:hypothetical protein ARMSODRAFT_1088327 [Armillaria solidipes]|uniref:Uncharacterized protein n=1 Tax=Armillaria solidipes TaxID=1076256 RepID=A0A2H3B4C8_9AGAR|nr:hypothetical protein ARMSODRAFT_1088327 [Armillaria solidipes]